MFDFDHPMKSMRHEVLPVLQRYGYAANLFINTGLMDDMYRTGVPDFAERQFLLWEEAGELAAAGWQIGAHTVTHPNLSQLSQEDPTGEKLRAELEQCDATIKKHLDITPQDFAFTGTSWSSAAEREVKARYRFGRLWIVGAEYQVDGKKTRYADLVGVPGTDEADGRPALRRALHHTRIRSLPASFNGDQPAHLHAGSLSQLPSRRFRRVESETSCLQFAQRTREDDVYPRVPVLPRAAQTRKSQWRRSRRSRFRAGRA